MTEVHKHPVPIHNLLQTIDAGRLLDVASGVGQFTRILVDCLGGYEQVIGIDTSATAIERANSGFTESDVSFEVADATTLPFPDDSFDAVSFSNSLHHMKDLEAVFSEIQRVLIPGGQLILFEMHSDAPSSASQNAIDLHLWAASVDRAIGRFHDPVMTREQLVSQFEGLNLQHRTVIDWHSEDETDNLEPILQAIDQVLKSAEGTPEQSELANEADILKERIRSRVRMSSGSPFSGDRTRASASFAHRETQTPQPMQAASSIRTSPSCNARASNGQDSIHCPQPMQSVSVRSTTYPDDASIGVPFRLARMAPQQHEQQLQMA